MSLTGHLENRGSAVSRFMAAELPGVKDMQAAYRSMLHSGGAVVRPAPPEGVRAAWGTLGHAIEHRLRYAFADVAELSPAVRSGMLGAAGRSDSAAGSAVGRTAGDLRALVAELVASDRPADRGHGLLLGPDREELLQRVCYVLGWFEEVYRTGRLWPGTPLGDAGPGLNVRQLLAAVPGYAVADIGAQACLAAERLAGLRAASQPDQVTPWASFAGSGDVGGADADLLVGDLLLEIKSRAAQALRREDIYQLVGYVLLDYPDDHQIGRVGWYLTRHGYLVTWTVTECLTFLGAQHPIADLRQRLASTLAASTPTARSSRRV